MGRITDEQLLNLIDGSLPEPESAELRQEIEQNPDLNKRYRFLMMVENQLETDMLQSPPADFPDKVMDHLHDPAYKPKSIMIFDQKAWMVFLTILTGVAIGIYLLATGSVNIPVFETMNLKPLSVQDKNFDLQPIMNMLNGSTFFKIFLLFDLVLAILILDRAVFKPYFKRRHQTFSH